MQTTPRFLKAGEGNRVLSTSSCFIQSVVLTAKTGACSLSLWNSGSTITNATAANNRLWLRSGGVSSPATISMDLGGTLFGSGLAVTLNGVGARAVVFVSNQTRGQ